MHLCMFEYISSEYFLRYDVRLYNGAHCTNSSCWEALALNTNQQQLSLAPRWFEPAELALHSIEVGFSDHVCDKGLPHNPK